MNNVDRSAVERINYILSTDHQMGRKAWTNYEKGAEVFEFLFTRLL
jgi:hypothetical protein